ncbi:conjugal transfer protein TrbL [Nocardioides sp. NPDC058538]|uniref:conjugal transfer protein TrbL n=1 Tax=Nocardioides sp. NPDC058538 TaxID=3346542 RepID=UPI003665975F
MPVCDIPGVSEVCNVAGEQATSALATPFKWVADALAATAVAVIEGTWEVIDTTTMVDLTTGEFTRIYNIVFGIAIFVMLGFFLLQVMGGMLRREPAALTRAIVGLAKSVLGSFLAITLLATALEITDRLATGIVHASGTSMEQMGDRLALLAGGLTAISTRNPSVGIIVTIILASLMISASFLVWLSMLARKALLLIAVVLAPLALAGASWDHTRTWVGRWAAFVIALITSKLVVVIIFLLATSMVSSPIEADLAGISDPLAGVVLLLIAGFAPYLVYKAINFMGFDMYHAMSAEQETKHALNRPIPTPARQPSFQPPKVLGDQGGQGSTPPATPPMTNPSAGASSPTAAAPAAAGSGAAGGGAAAVPPAAAAVAGAYAAKEAATAGPRIGSYVGSTTQQHADAGEQTPSQSQHSPQTTDTPRPSTPSPHVVDPMLGPQPGASS